MRATCDSLLRPGPDCVVADASIVINLGASLGFEMILRKFPYRFMVTALVQEELEQGRDMGHTAAAELASLAATGRAEIICPGGLASDIYVYLTSQRPGRPLDNGEAETIACAEERGGIALIDENRARRVCESDFPQLAVASSVDVFAHPQIAGLGQQTLASLVRNAVVRGRMHVVRCEDWVEELVEIGSHAAGAAGA